MAQGTLTVIAGCMFSGKSEELLRLLRRAAIARQSTIVIKPAIDTRSEAQVCSRDGHCVTAVSVPHTGDIIAAATPYDVIGIDEAQFFDDGIVAVVRDLYTRGKRVIVAGLDTDYRGESFGAMPHLMAIPEADVLKLRAVCMQCSSEATRTFRKTTNSAQVDIGDADKYVALCFSCYHAAGRVEAPMLAMAATASR